jgi:hypothetical protein
VTVCLQLSEQKAVDRSSCSQGNATEARTLLSASLCDKLLATLGLHVADKEEMNTSKRYFRGCFPLRSGDCISFDGLDILSAEYPPIPTRRIVTYKFGYVLSIVHKYSNNNTVNPMITFTFPVT